MDGWNFHRFLLEFGLFSGAFAVSFRGVIRTEKKLSWEVFDAKKLRKFSQRPMNLSQLDPVEFLVILILVWVVVPKIFGEYLPRFH